MEESATYAFIWMAFVGASLGLKHGRHILIATFGSRLPPRVAAVLRMLVWALVFVMLVVLVVQGWQVMGIEGRSKTISLPIELPRSWFYSLPLTLSAASMALTTVYLFLIELPVLGGGAASATHWRPRRCRYDLAGAVRPVRAAGRDRGAGRFRDGAGVDRHDRVTQPIPLSIVVQRMGTGLDSFVLIAIPLFVLAGHLLNRAGIADRIFEFAAALVGHIRGGLAHVNVVASMIFAGMSGVAQADAAGLGVVEVNAMRKEGFDPAFAAAVSAASAIIGPIIPPSVIMVVYAVMVQASVADLFLAGFLPGILMGGALMVMIYWMVRTGRVVAPATQTDVVSAPGPQLLARGAGAGRADPAHWRAARRRRDADRTRRADGGVRRGARFRPARADR